MAEDWIIDESDLQYLENLGSGICGEVHHVILKTKDGRTVEAAAKRFRENGKESDIASQKKELNFLRQLKHPNIVEFFCAVLCPITVIVTEFAAKGSLYEYLKRQIRLPVCHMLEWARQATSAVKYLQQENVVHRDIKSSNFVITNDDILKLCDFGIAKRQCRTEKTNQERGTIPWMAPEAIDKLTSKASDIYSLGIVIWELVSCEIPYPGKESLCILYAVKVHKLRPEIPSHCPPALRKLLGKCWKEDRKKRPKVDKVLHTIEALIQKHENDKGVTFHNKHGKQEICHLYQRHLAIENEQNALVEVVIPVDNGVSNSTFTDDRFDSKASFDHVDINGNLSTMSARRGLPRRYFRFTVAFIIMVLGIALVVVGLSTGLRYMLEDDAECTIPSIHRATLQVKPLQHHNGVKKWSSEVICDEGFEWTGGSNVIVCEEGVGHWNVSNHFCRKKEHRTSSHGIQTKASSGMSYAIHTTSTPYFVTDQGVVTTHPPHFPNGNDDESLADSLHLLQTLTALTTETETTGSETTVHHDDDGSGSNRRPNYGLGHTSKNGTASVRISTKLPEKTRATTVAMSVSEPTNRGKNSEEETSTNSPAGMQNLQSSTAIVYQLVLCGTPNPDDSINATVYRRGDVSNGPGSVDICVQTNCTSVKFPQDSGEVQIRFTVSESNQHIHQNDQQINVMLKNPQNGEIENINNATNLPRNADGVFNIIMGDG